MAFATKYIMSFQDVTGKEFEVTFATDGWTGEVTPLTGTENPVEITYSGSEEDIFAPIIDFKAQINILIPKFNQDFYNDISSGNDKTFWVEIKDVTDNFVYSGWLLPDESHRTFDTFNYEISLTVASPLTIMKGLEMLDVGGIMLYGEYTVRELVEAAFRDALPFAPVFNYFTNTADAHRYLDAIIIYGTTLDDHILKMEGLNDDNGRPPKCYDFIERVGAAYGMRFYWQNNTIFAVDIRTSAQYSDVEDLIKSVVIKTPGVTTNFLINNSEDITKVKAAKELSVKWDFQKNNGLLQNGRFLQFNETTNMFVGWDIDDLLDSDSVPVYTFDSTALSRHGSGRPIDPFRARITAGVPGAQFNDAYRITTENTPGESIFQGFRNSVYIDQQGDYEIKIRFKYFDWKAKYGSDINANSVPAFTFFWLHAPDSITSPKQILSCGEVRNISGSNLSYFGNTGKEDYATPHQVIVSTGEGRHKAIVVAIDSVNSVQEYSGTFNFSMNSYDFRWPTDPAPPSDFPGSMYFIMLPMWFNSPPSTFDPADNWIELVDVIISQVASASGTKVSGEENYITQVKDFSYKGETEDIYIGTYNNKSMAGATLYENDVPEIVPSQGVFRGSMGYYPLQQDLLMSKMALNRTPSHRVDFECRSNDIRFSDMIKFKEGDTDLLPHNYMFVSYTYNVKEAEIKGTAFELKDEVLPSDKSQPPTPPDDTKDMYESYNIIDQSR